MADASSRSVLARFVPADGAAPPRAGAPAHGVFDPLSYGVGPLPDWADEPLDVHRTMVLDRLPRLTPGGPAYAYTVDGLVYPHIEPTVVRGRRHNGGHDRQPGLRGASHASARPSRARPRGRRPTTDFRPLWLDSFDVLPGQVWKVALTSPTTPASGWITATTSSTRRWGW